MKNKIPLIIALIIISLSIYLFYTLFESYEKTEDLGWDKKALRNPYLAAEKYLLRNKINASSSNNFEELAHLPDNGIIFISDSRKILTKKRVDSIVTWLNNGGHLIITAPIYNKNKPSALLSKFNVKNKLIKKNIDTIKNKKKVKQKKLSDKLSEHNKEIKSKKTNKNIKKTIPEDEITYLSFSSIKEKLKINFSSNSDLTHPYLYREDDYKRTAMDPTYWAGNEQGTYFMQFSVGDGLLSIITDNSIWRSSNIDNLDHAYLLWVLSDNNSKVVLLYGANMPSIFYYMWEYSSEFIIAFTLWLFFWLFYRSKRFGKIYNESDTVKRSISEHIKASAEYFWNNKKYEQLIDPLRADIFKQTNRLYPYFDNISQSEQLKLISDHSNVGLDIVAISLVQPFSGTENEFTRLISSLQIIRNSL